MRWAEFEEEAPELAALGTERLEEFGFAFLGTLRKDGGPRVNPVEVHLVDGELTLALMPRSVKAIDLLRDSRAYLHTPILEAELGRPGEFKLRTRAVRVEDATLRDAIRDKVERASGWRPPADWRFFRLDIESAAFHEYDETADVHVLKRWTPNRGYEATTRTITT
jgi:Pyridoxamine 5'-phosphate oxidase